MTGCTRHVMAAALMLAAFAPARSASACSCKPKVGQCQALSDASVVFVGTVLSIDSVTDPEEQHRVHFEVAEAFRGITTPSIDVDTLVDLDFCGYTFAIGERYLVFADRYASDWPLMTDSCTRTQPLQTAQEDLAYLRSVGNAPATGGVLSGTVRHLNETKGKWRADDPYASYRPVAGVGVSVQCRDGVVHRTETNAAGRFEFRGLPVGSCSPHITPPALTYLQEWRREVMIRDVRACVDLDVMVGYDGHIRGHVVDEGLRPLSGVTLGTFQANLNGRYAYSAITDASGAFDIAKLPPGRYVIGINGRNVGTSGPALGRAIYFPGVETADGVEVVTLGPGDDVNLGDFRLKSDVAFVSVSGTVVTENESPFGGARVYVLRAGTSAVFAGPFMTDEQGRFTLSVPQGEPITLKVQARFLIGEASFFADTDQPALWIVLKPLKP